MTDIVVDIRNVASQVHPDDRVYVWAPYLRERAGGGLVSTAPQEVRLPDGQATITDVEPGPLMIRFECMGISDTGDKQGVVPDGGPVSIFEVLKSDLTWTPPVVDRGLDQIEAARDDAIGQVGDAVDGAIGTRLDMKADVDTVSDLSALMTGVTGVARRSSRMIRALAAGLADKADASALATKADKASVAVALSTKADVAMVDELSILVVSALGVGRRNASRIRELVSVLATKADVAMVDELSILVVSALGVGRRNAARIGQIATTLTTKADTTTVEGIVAQKADTRTLDARIPAGGHSGQLLMATPTGGRWSWADRHPTQYHDIY